MKKKLKKILEISPLSIYERYRDFKCLEIKIEEREKLIEDYFSNAGIIKLQIGCGDNILEGWLNTDLNSSREIAYLDAGGNFPLPNNSVDFIFSEHLFEHLNIVQQKNMLKESFRVLKRGGVLRIATPSLDFLTDLHLNPLKSQNKKYTKWAVEKIPGLFSVKLNVNDENVFHNYVINHFFKAWGHQMIHDYRSIKSLALETGFLEVNQEKVGKSNFPELEGIEKHGNIIPEEINEIETMVVEIKK